jgi:hypothetical protein
VQGFTVREKCLLLAVFIRFNRFTPARISCSVVYNELPADWEPSDPSDCTLTLCETASRLSNYGSLSFNNYIGYILALGVGIATGYGLDDRGVGVRVPVGSSIFSSPHRPDWLWGPPSLVSNE